MRPEREHSINGVPGRMFASHSRDESLGTFYNQTWKATRPHPAEPHYRVTVEMRFDDNCGNGHNTFSITGEVKDSRYKGERAWVSGGQCVEDIAAAFPELVPLLKWHLCSSDEPMHYVANAVYLAGDRDCHGLRAGEVRQILNGKTGLPCWIRRGRGTEYYDGAEWPTDTYTVEWEPLTRTGDGKARELDAARRAAVWPEATDEQLSVEPTELRAMLEARLPQLMRDFRDAIEAAGFEWSSAAP